MGIRAILTTRDCLHYADDLSLKHLLSEFIVQLIAINLDNIVFRVVIQTKFGS